MHKPSGLPYTQKVDDRRVIERRALSGPVRLFVLCDQDQPIVERHAAGINITSDGMAVAVRIPLNLGTRMIASLDGPDGAVLWHVRVVHILHHEHHSVLGLKRLEMPEGLAKSQWIRTLSAIS